ncbi:phage baseplate assembly protein V [Agrobacterium salinitolerans]|uniref:Phage baseplate assembly protein V n=1 Tax=Agrobacterium salinitolerans TaxID=1183413 RepID=A0A4Z1QW20_9HYPH|nr:phage baseplate assembly protein V [Agrobacterium salinitolerans]UYZ08558.1 phage baseplate assembly protein V [Agrobacterium salinitolerans]
MKEIAEIINRMNGFEKRLSSMVRHGPVAEVNPAEGWVRLNLGEGEKGPLLSPKIPYAQMAGALKVHAPPSEGQQMTYFAPSGDPRQAVALPMTWSDANPSPSASGEENVLTFGSVTIAIKGDRVRITVGATWFEISTGGIKAQSDDYDFQ